MTTSTRAGACVRQRLDVAGDDEAKGRPRPWDGGSGGRQTRWRRGRTTAGGAARAGTTCRRSARAGPQPPSDVAGAERSRGSEDGAVVTDGDDAGGTMPRALKLSTFCTIHCLLLFVCVDWGIWHWQVSMFENGQ